MMEIKFRAWITEAKTMARVSDISFINEELDICDEDLDLPSGDWYSFDDVVLMQYTGLTDKNGVEICEGDIVRNGKTIVYSTGETRRFEDVGIVRYDTKNGCLVINNDDGRTKRLTKKVIARNKVEVIGNIYT